MPDRPRLVLIILLLTAAVAGVSVLAAADDSPTTVAPDSGPATAAASARIDQLCEAKLKQLGLVPAAPCSDQVFLRRVYLDVIGTLPTVEEARSFLDDRHPAKREQLIERLLARPEFADYWALKWSDVLRIKSEYPVRLWPKATQAYYRYVRESLAANKPYNRFATELLTATGSNFRDGAANFYRSVNSKDPQSFAESAALLFMGVRLSCARCHDHPSANWKLQDNLGLAAFFGQVKFKATGEWKEEIVYLDADAKFLDPQTRKPVTPKFLDGPQAELAPGQDARAAFAEWLTSPRNPWFSRNVVNRVWSWLLGRGLVHEPDDLRPANPPSHPELLDYLAGELIKNDYDLKQIYRIILRSQTYQRSSDPAPGPRDDGRSFGRYAPRRLPAEVLLDAISQLTETTESYSSQIPEPWTKLTDWRAIMVVDGSISSPFLELFGRPPRDTPLESERCSTLSMRQTLYLLNSSDIERKIAASGRLKRLLQQKKSDAEIIDELYLAAFSRAATEAEKLKLQGLMKERKSRAEAAGDLLWAILNSREFVFNH